MAIVRLVDKRTGEEILDGSMKLRFLPVDGTSQLPIEFMSTGENREKLSPVTMPKFWIARDGV